MANIQTAVITGAGSGVGRALAIMLTRAGWRVAIAGRREASLQQTLALMRGAGSMGNSALALPCDVGDLAQVKRMAGAVLAAFEHVDVLVNSAGTNIAKRSLRDISETDFEMMMAANLHGSYYCVQAFLPGMRARGSGTIVNIGSRAGLAAAPVAGVAYVMGKFGMRGLTQAINAEERANGIRACHVAPGDINTEILDKRPNPPPMAVRGDMLQAEDVAECALLAINLPPRAVVEEIVVSPK